jgi:GntR family transcriptional regulator
MSEETEIVDKFIFDINTGQYEPDDKLPSENEIADLFKVPRITARKAYKRLQELGYIHSIQGKGSYVKNRQKKIPLILSGNVSFSQKMVEQGYDYRSENIFCEEIPFNKSIYQELGVNEKERIFKIGRLRLIDVHPIALHISYVPQSLFHDIEWIGREITSIFDYYKRNGYTEFESKNSVLRVSFPLKLERELLKCSSLIPLLVVESGCIDKKTGNVLEYTRILYRSDYFTYVIE